MRCGSDQMSETSGHVVRFHTVWPLELKADLCDTIQEKRIRAEERCLDWLEHEERVDTPNQKLDDMWAIPLNLECGELQLRECRMYLRKYRRLLRQIQDWSQSGEIRRLLLDVLPPY